MWSCAIVWVVNFSTNYLWLGRSSGFWSLASCSTTLPCCVYVRVCIYWKLSLCRICWHVNKPKCQFSLEWTWLSHQRGTTWLFSLLFNFHYPYLGISFVRLLNVDLIKQYELLRQPLLWQWKLFKKNPILDRFSEVWSLPHLVPLQPHQNIFDPIQRTRFYWREF